MLRTTATAITAEQIKTLVAAVYRALDNHDSVEDVYRYFADDGLKLIFPEGEFGGFDGFKQWYENAINKYFDEVHNVQSVQPNISGNSAAGSAEHAADVDIVVGWQATWWDPPAAKSKRLSIDATQRWTVRPSSRNPYGLEIVTYNALVEAFQAAPGFARF